MSWSEWGPVMTALSSIATGVAGILGTLLIQRSKGRVDSAGQLATAERDFRNDILKRLDACEKKHTDCERRVAELQEDLLDLREQLATIRGRRSAANIEDPEGDMT